MRNSRWTAAVAALVAAAALVALTGCGGPVEARAVVRPATAAAVGPDSVGQPGSGAPSTTEAPDGIGAGSPAQAVTQVQALLVSRGVAVPVDGRWDGPTADAVAALRTAAGLGPGRFDEAALDALDAVHPTTTVPAPTTAPAQAPPPAAGPAPTVPAPTVPAAAPAPAPAAPPAAGPARPAGACRVSLVGDSLVAIFVDMYRQALEARGCAATVDGLSSRSLADGTLCNGSRCGPQGLEVLRGWAKSGQLAPTVVVALGTNDAGIGTEARWRDTWSRAMDLARGHRVLFVTPVGRNKLADKRARYAAELRRWCPQHGCGVVDWAAQPAAQVAANYADDVHLNRTGSKARAGFLAAAAAG